MTRVTAAQWVTAIISAIGLLGGILGGISTLRSANAAAEKSEADRDEQQFARLERELARLGKRSTPPRNPLRPRSRRLGSHTESRRR